MKCLRVSLFFLLLAPSALASTLRGVVLDIQGAVIPNASVFIHWDRVGLDGVQENVGMSGDKAFTSDTSGRFSLELPPGVYDIFVGAAGFFPHCEKITVKKDEIRSYKVQLRVSRMETVRLD